MALAGCAALGVRGEPLDLRALDTATGIVWHDVYGRRDRAPVVRIVQGDALDCTDPISGTPGFRVLLYDGYGCRNGYTLTPDQVSVSWTGQAWSATALAHELMHAAHGRDGIADPLHKRAEWGPGGAVDAANARLRDKGL